MRRRIVDDRGFAGPFIAHTPLERVDIGNASIGSGPFTLPPALARLRLKEWQHYCLITDEVLVTLAIVDAKFTRIAWVQVVDLATGERHEHHHQTPFARVRLSEALWDDRCSFRTRGFALDIHNHLSNQNHTLALDAAPRGDVPGMSAELEILHDPSKVESMVVCLPVGHERCAYTHKVPVPVRGSLRVGDRTYRFDEASAVAILDIHKAHYPRDMFWRWATFAGHDDAGRLVGLNLTKNVVEDDVVWNENAAWVDGHVTRFGPAVFDFNRSDPSCVWRLGTADDRVHIEFRPEGSRGERLDVAGLLRSRFNQFYGRFYGVVDTGETTIEVDGLWGLCEDHEAVW